MSLFLDDPYLDRFQSSITSVRLGWIALSETAFYPGGGGQPPDTGYLSWEGERVRVEDLRQDESGVVWHKTEGVPPTGAHVTGVIDWVRRYSFMRHHTLLHIVNAIVLDRHEGLITGVQIGEGSARIDFRIEGFSRAMLQPIEDGTNTIITADLPVDSYQIDLEEFNAQPELIRTANVSPPVWAGKVRVVRIGDFDRQACGGTHVHRTNEVGLCRIRRFENKGKNNKRLYLELDPPQ